MKFFVLVCFTFSLLFALPDEFDRERYNIGEKFLIINAVNVMKNQCPYLFL